MDDTGDVQPLSYGLEGQTSMNIKWSFGTLTTENLSEKLRPVRISCSKWTDNLEWHINSEEQNRDE